MEAGNPDTRPRLRNPYRSLTKFRPPWSLVLLLALIWGWWIHDGHFGEHAGEPAADAEKMALRCMDRSLRFQDTLEDAPLILRWWTGWTRRDDALRDFRDGFGYLQRQEALGPDGHAAWTVLHLELGETPPPGLESASLLEIGVSNTRDLDLLCKRLEGGRAQWWERTAARRMFENAEPSGKSRLRLAIAIDEKRDIPLARRYWITSAVDLLLIVTGLCLLPAATRRTRAGWAEWKQERSRDFPWRWKPSLTLSVFLIADLAALIFAMWLYGNHDDVGMTFVQETLADLSWRVVAPAVALLILFRRSRHAVRVLRMDRTTCWTIVISAFAFLCLTDILMYESIGKFMAFDATGGLSGSEEGLQGLVFGFLSACIAAPLVEEIMFRGVLLRGMEKTLGFGLAVIVASVPFAISHFYDLYGVLGCLFFGIAAAVVYRATGSLRTAIALHVLYNLTITLPSWWIFHAGF